MLSELSRLLNDEKQPLSRDTSLTGGLAFAPHDGSPAVMATPTYTGSNSELGEREIARCRKALLAAAAAGAAPVHGKSSEAGAAAESGGGDGGLIADLSGRAMTYAKLQRSVEGATPPGIWHGRTILVRELSDELIAILIDGFKNCPKGAAKNSACVAFFRQLFAHHRGVAVVRCP